jgi:hypothetical protein
LKAPGVEQPRVEVDAPATAEQIVLRADGVEATCRRVAELPPLTPPPAG